MNLLLTASLSTNTSNLRPDTLRTFSKVLDNIKSRSNKHIIYLLKLTDGEAINGPIIGFQIRE